MKFPAIFMLLCALWGACSSRDEVCGRRQGLHSWTGYRWPRNKRDLNIDDNTGDSAWGDTLGKVEKDWNDLGTAFWLYEDSHEETDILVVLVEDVEYSGLAEVWLTEEGELNKVRVSVNKTKMLDYNAAAKRHVLCQEVGHALGLFHIEGNTCMDDCSYLPANSEEKKACAEDVSKIGPNDHDREQLIMMYGEYEDPCF